jgi:hypothetical protein
MIEVRNLILPEDQEEIRIVQVKGLDERAPAQVGIMGNIDTVLRFLEKRYAFALDLDVSATPNNLVFPLVSSVVINRTDKQITLTFDETNGWDNGVITGSLKYDPRFLKWKLNNGHKWEQEDFALFCKMNRSLFTDPTVAMKIHKELMDVKIKVTREFESSNDNRGNDRRLVSQKVINNNIPMGFTLLVPIFKGVPKVPFDVEIYVDPSDFKVTLTSPQANDIESDITDGIIDEQKAAIQVLCPDLVIIEQ